jgi:hypothetical protein
MSPTPANPVYSQTPMYPRKRTTLIHSLHSLVRLKMAQGPVGRKATGCLMHSAHLPTKRGFRSRRLLKIKSYPCAVPAAVTRQPTPL